MERDLDSLIDPKPSYQEVVENAANLGKIDKKKFKKYSNVIYENKTHPDAIDSKVVYQHLDDNTVDRSSFDCNIDFMKQMNA